MLSSPPPFLREVCRTLPANRLQGTLPHSVGNLTELVQMYVLMHGAGL